MCLREVVPKQTGQVGGTESSSERPALGERFVSVLHPAATSCLAGAAHPGRVSLEGKHQLLQGGACQKEGNNRLLQKEPPGNGVENPGEILTGLVVRLSLWREPAWQQLPTKIPVHTSMGHYFSAQ